MIWGMTIKESDLTSVDDTLALTRTILSNERTLLSYTRTGMAFLVAGVGIMQFVDKGIYILISGWLLIVMGIYIFCWGHMNYQKFKKILV